MTSCDHALMTERDHLADARRDLAAAYERNADAERRGASAPVGAGALLVLRRRVDEAEAAGLPVA